jgi:hypothetical protein
MADSNHRRTTEESQPPADERRRCGDAKGLPAERLDEVADKLNRRPRKTLGFATPAEKLAELIDGLGKSAAER